MLNNILNIIVIIGIIIFLSIGFFKLKYPFWSRQPVFHFHLIHPFLHAADHSAADNSLARITPTNQPIDL